MTAVSTTAQAQQIDYEATKKMFSVRDPIRATRMKNNRRLFEQLLKEKTTQRLKERIAEYSEERSPFNPAGGTQPVETRSSHVNNKALEQQ